MLKYDNPAAIKDGDEKEATGLEGRVTYPADRDGCGKANMKNFKGMKRSLQLCVCVQVHTRAKACFSWSVYHSFSGLKTWSVDRRK